MPSSLRQRLLLATVRNVPSSVTPSSISTAVRYYADRQPSQKKPQDQPQSLHASFILKPNVGPHERGLLLIHFAHELKALLGSAHFRDVEERYGIIFMSSWVTPFDDEVCELAARARQRFWIMPSVMDDLDRCKLLGPLCVPLPFHSASWLNPAFFPPSQHKTTDLTMVANFASFKRHWKLFEAMSQIPKSVTAEVIGSPLDGRSLADLMREARCFGVQNRITFRENPPRDVVVSALARSRVFCAMSQAEGSYVAVVEAMMANTPVAMFSNARVGSAIYVNSMTGRFLDPTRPTGPQLLDMLQSADQFQPAAWARQNLSADVQVASLNEKLRRTTDGEWTLDVSRFYQHRQKKLYFGGEDQEQEMSSAYLELHSFGFDFHRPEQYPEATPPEEP